VAGETRIGPTADEQKRLTPVRIGDPKPTGCEIVGCAPEKQPTAASDKGTPQHLLVCLDRSSTAYHLIHHAAALARVWMSRVTLIHVLESDRGKGTPSPTDAVQWLLRRQEASRFLAEAISEPAHRNLEMEVELGEGQAFEQIQAWSSAHEVDLTVLSTHGEGGITSCGLSGTAYKLIDGLNGSFLVIPAHEGRETSSVTVTYKRILVPLDGSLHAASVLPIAAQLAEAHGSELILAHVIPVPELMRVGPPTDEDLQIEESLLLRNQKIAARYLADLRSQLQSDRFHTRTCLRREGQPRDELLRIIHDEEVDLVVLSAHGATGATDRALGSVAAHLVAHAKVPLLFSRKRTKCTFHWDRASAGIRSVPTRLPAVTAV
jgi:nucleotide-binding universal stress UspA family protein